MTHNSLRKITLCFILLTTSLLSLYSQEEERFIWNTEHKSCIYNKNTVVRDTPSQKGKTINTLSEGDTLHIIKVEQIKENSKDVFYAQIEYFKNKKQKTGYINYDDICFIYLQKENITFLLQIEREDEDDSEKSVIYKLKAINGQNRTTSEYQFEGKKSGSIYLSVDLKNQLPSNLPRLHNVENIITICSSGEACAIPSFYYYLAWTGKEILPIIHSWEAGEAGAYTLEEIIFPDENIPSNVILKLYLNREEEDDYTKEEENISLPESGRVEIYLWDGRKASLMNQSESIN